MTVTMSTATPDIDVTSTPEYTAGRVCFERGGHDTDCPYPISSGNGQRLRWMKGFHDTRTDKWLAEWDERRRLRNA